MPDWQGGHKSPETACGDHGLHFSLSQPVFRVFFMYAVFQGEALLDEVNTWTGDHLGKNTCCTPWKSDWRSGHQSPLQRLKSLYVG